MGAILYSNKYILCTLLYSNKYILCTLLYSKKCILCTLFYSNKYILCTLFYSNKYILCTLLYSKNVFCVHNSKFYVIDFYEGLFDLRHTILGCVLQDFFYKMLLQRGESTSYLQFSVPVTLSHVYLIISWCCLMHPVNRLFMMYSTWFVSFPSPDT